MLRATLNAVSAEVDVALEAAEMAAVVALWALAVGAPQAATDGHVGGRGNGGRGDAVGGRANHVAATAAAHDIGIFLVADADAATDAAVIDVALVNAGVAVPRRRRRARRERQRRRRGRH